MLRPGPRKACRSLRPRRQAGVVADPHVFEGQPHPQYAGDPDAAETKEHFGELMAFFDKHLAK